MKGNRFLLEQIIRVIKESGSEFKKIDIRSKYGISEQTFYNCWKSKYSGMEVIEAMRLKVVEDEDRKLKGLFAELSLDNKILKDLSGKNF